ncbi:MAG TPA: amidohydrolase family protein [Candidatus Dormibacteraeota bacterium]|nr:amidohydrolase family protein [Candidatus Dormibacteraeota bacterium]
MARYEVISADGHVETPLDFERRVPASHRDFAPKLVDKDDGSQWWVVNEELAHDNVGNLYCGLRFDEFTPATAGTYFHPDGSPRPGTGNAVQRLREQDLDGISAEVLYPPVFMGGLIRPLAKRNPDAYRSIIRAYNDFLGLEYCAVAPDRLIGNAMVPATGVDDAIAEMQHAQEIGLRSICLSAWPNGSDDPAPEDDRFWAAALEMDMKLSPHGSFGGGTIQSPTGLTAELATVGMPGLGVGACIGKLMASGVFDRFPGIRFYFAETHAGWLPYQLSGRMDEFYMRWYRYFDVPLSKLPSQYYRDHCRFSFIQDRMAMEFRHYIGLEMLMWGTDFPHSETTFPHTRRILPELFDGVPENERRQVLRDNVIEFFSLDAERELTPTP